jgi:cell wall-associated NlpC family hydrolase
MSAARDPRTNAFRDDIADERLHGEVPSARFVSGETRRVVANSAPLKRRAASDAPLDSEILRGEAFTVFGQPNEGWAWGQHQTDGYVGYVPADALAVAGAEPTHRVSALRAFIYPGPDLKAEPLGVLSFGAKVALARETVTRGSTYGELAGGEGWLAAMAVEKVTAAPQPDFVAVAERFLHTPYLWGGRTSLGVDCSSLVQLSLAATGVSAPRDTDLQEAALGAPVEGGVSTTLKRGDLIFWKGHVAIALDSEAVIHASGHHMAVVREPLRAAIGRIEKSAGPPRMVKRL